MSSSTANATYEEIVNINRFLYLSPPPPPPPPPRFIATPFRTGGQTLDTNDNPFIDCSQSRIGWAAAAGEVEAAAGAVVGVPPGVEVAGVLPGVEVVEDTAAVDPPGAAVVEVTAAAVPLGAAVVEDTAAAVPLGGVAVGAAHPLDPQGLAEEGEYTAVAGQAEVVVEGVDPGILDCRRWTMGLS